MRKLAPDWTLDSAGTAGWHAGAPPYPPMVQAAKLRGFDLSALRARQFKKEDFAVFDMIVAMDDDNLKQIKAISSGAQKAQLVTLMEFARHTGIGSVPDPYYTRDFDAALDLIEAGCQGLLATLAAPDRI